MLTALFDFDGTLVDSDAALLAPFRALGVDPATIPLGLPLGDACARAGISVADYLSHYDQDAVQPFPGVEQLLRGLERWGVCSNKARTSGVAELARLQWSPAIALFSDDFGGAPKSLGPVLGALAIDPREAVFIGDTDHDRTAARSADVRFALAGWNPRAIPATGDLVLDHPRDLLTLLR